MKQQQLMIPVITAAVVVGAAAFFAGTKYQQTKQQSFFRQGGRMMQGTGAPGVGRNGTGNFRPVAGEISSVSGSTMTVKLQNGESRIVVFSDKTDISKSAAATSGDLASGEKVAVFGTTNADGSVTAQSIQLNPQMRAFTGPSGK